MIIDASVAFKWVVNEPDSEEAIAWIGRAELFAPVLMVAEVANALRKRVRRGELSPPDGIGEQLSKVAQLVRTIDETPVLGRALEMAIEISHPVYDCVYLALAELAGEELLTADMKFINKIGGTSFAPLVRAF